ncbi:hypothetical protein [Chthonobacter albigriseus]|uniref:hypothetical protein n=1 Tax=Chthonobacter albigriseus TaxID=1683161 RepID=UPI0015EF78C9|nr:hypothetical protein [Chthonobacter albigriseus]
MDTDPHSAKPSRTQASRMDLVASVVLPLAVMGLGVALSAEASGGLNALVDICLSVIR